MNVAAKRKPLRRRLKIGVVLLTMLLTSSGCRSTKLFDRNPPKFATQPRDTNTGFQFVESATKRHDSGADQQPILKTKKRSETKFQLTKRLAAGSSSNTEADAIESEKAKAGTDDSNIGLVGFQESKTDAAKAQAKQLDLQTADNSETSDSDSKRADDDSTATEAERESENSTDESAERPNAATNRATRNSANSNVTANPLELNEVIDAVADCYPLINVAIGELEAAEGKIIASWGQFDTIVSAYSIAQPLGFYQTYQNGTALSQPLFGGGELYGGYRIGDGNFEPWYGERETNEGGELKTGFSLPLLKDRAIDARRANLYAAGYQRDELESNVEARLLMFERFATQTYWEWVASGRVVEIQTEILELAEERVSQIQRRLEAGDLARIAQIDNDRFIAKRKSELIKAERKFQQSAIKLSLFYRDVECRPVIAGVDRLPQQTPVNGQLSEATVAAAIMQAISIRPELAELEAQRRQACVDLKYAENLTLPKLDVKGFAGQDVGGETSSTGDKTPFELQLGVFAEVPVQRREGVGKIRAAEGKLAELEAKRQFLSEKITVEVQDAASAINAAIRNIEQSQLNVDLNQQSLELARISFEAGDIDLIELNLYETSVADAGLELISAQLEYFFFVVAYETAIAGR